jgi:hypothetical protein
MSEDSIALFRASLANAKQYPLNLVKIGSRYGVLRAHRRLLETHSRRLFNPRTKVVVIEFGQDEHTGGAASKTVTTKAELDSWLVVPGQVGSTVVPSANIGGSNRNHFAESAPADQTPSTPHSPLSTATSEDNFSKVRCRFM